MKKMSVVLIAIIGVAIWLLTTASDDMSTYSTFADAVQNGKKVKVVAQLAKDKEMYYDPGKDPNYFTFYAKDKDGKERKVVFLGEKQRDFELSEQIVLTGKMQGEEFVASDMLMKCPSKYKDEEIYMKSVEG
ncbi:MAG: cytochrome c maturation protein CcmE [Bacteroidota bacterium]